MEDVFSFRYRAWDVLNSKMHSFEECAVNGWNPVSPRDDTLYPKGHPRAFRSRFVYMMSTGMFTRAGKELYHKDIVIDNKGAVRVIKWNKGTFVGNLLYFEKNNLRSALIDIPIEFIAKHYSLYGNVYENPEFLRVRSDDIVVPEEENIIEKCLPKTFYAHLSSEERLKMMVSMWQKGISVIREMSAESDLENYGELACTEHKYCPSCGIKISLWKRI